MLNYQRVSLSIALSKSSLPEGILSRSFLFEGYQGWYPSDVVCNQLFSEDALGFLVDKALGNIRWLVAFKNPTEKGEHEFTPGIFISLDEPFNKQLPSGKLT